MFGLFRKKSKSTSEVIPSTSEENASALPDDKKSKSDIKNKKTNIILLVIAFVMLGIFIVGSLMTTSKDQQKLTDLSKSTIEDTSKSKKRIADGLAYVSPLLTVDPSTVEARDIIVGEESFNSILLSVANAPIRVSDVSFSTNVDGLELDQDCAARPTITPDAGCIINIIWEPQKKETKNIFILIQYNDPEGATAQNDGNDKGRNRSFKINLVLSSINEIVPDIEPIEEIFEDEFFDDEIYEEEEDEFFEEDIFPDESVEPIVSKRTVYPTDCKEYASKAYDFSGTFIGWVQGNNDVFSPNCSNVIGVVQDDGMVLETGTGRVIGKGVVFDKSKSEEKRIELALPMLDEVMASITSDNFNPNFEDVWENRLIIKDEGDIGQESAEFDMYKAYDPLNIIGKQKNELIPFTIVGAEQISSMPKNEKYILRQSKPIPAVLSRPIFFNNAELGGFDGTVFSENNVGNAVAIVERNVYGGDGRTIIIPTGSQLIGTAAAPPGKGLQETAKVNISWDRLIRPDGAEFDLRDLTAYTGDAQGRAGVAGKNDTEYMKDLFLKPLLYSALPVAMEALFPSTSALVTRVKKTDGTYQTIGDSFTQEDMDAGTTAFDWNDTETFLDMTSEDKMKAEIQQNFKTVMQKMIEQSSETSIPFTIAAGTRVMIFLNTDIMLRIDENMNDMIGREEHQYDGGGGGY